MAELPQDFEKSFLELMDEHKSEQTIKIKRNIDILSFSIIAANFIGLKLSDIKFLGADLASVNQMLLKVVVILVLLYWLAMLTGYIYKDKNYNIEKRYLLDRHLKMLTEYRNSQVKALKDNERVTQLHSVIKSRIDDVNNQYNIYVNQMERTKAARLSQEILRDIEYAMPYLLSFVAILILFVGG